MPTYLNAVAGFPAFCFGKLPTCADYLRHNAGGREVRAFDQWLQQGLFHARTELRDEWHASYDAAPAYHFLFFPENSECFLLGVMKASHDRSERGYPFTVALRIDRRFPHALLPLVPVLFGSFLEGASNLVESAAKGMPVQDVTNATDGLQTLAIGSYDAAVRSYGEHLASASVPRLIECLWGSSTDERVLLVFRNLLDVLLPLRGRNAARLAPGLRFPIPTAQPDLHFITSFWLDVALVLMRANSARPFLFWTAPATATDIAATNGNGSSYQHRARAHLFLFLREPSVRSVLHFLRPDLNGDFICEADVDGLGQIARARSSLPAVLMNALVASDTKLRGLMDLLANPLIFAASPTGGEC